MHLTFVAYGSEQLGLSLLSAIAKKAGHSSGLAFSSALFDDKFNLSFPPLAPLFDDKKQVIEEIIRQEPDVLVFSPLTTTYQWELDIAGKVKIFLPDVKVIFGGVHVSAVPERVISRACVDYVCIGEGDLAFPLILDHIQKGGGEEPIVNTRYKMPDGCIITGLQSGYVQDLDSLPVFDKTLWEEYIRIGDPYNALASRGCPYRCTFCFNNYFANLPAERMGGYMRWRSPEHMMEELRWAKQRYKLRFIIFQDDIFTLNKKWLKEFLGLYKKEIKVPFECLSHAKYLDEEAVGLLADAGCTFVQMGIQTVSDEVKETVIRRHESLKEIESAMRVTAKHRIHLRRDHMFCIPEEPLESQAQALGLYLKYPPYRIDTFWLNYFPGTELFYNRIEKGDISAEQAYKINEGTEGAFFRDKSSVIEKEKVRTYKAYDAVFKLMPITARCMQKKLSPGFFKKLPLWFCSLTAFTADVLSGLVKRDPHHMAYARHYIYHIYRFFLRKMGLKVHPATKVLSP